MFEGGGGSCCIQSIYNHPSNTFSLLSVIWLFNEHYDSDDLSIIIHDHIGKTNSLKVSQLREA